MASSPKHADTVLAAMPATIAQICEATGLGDGLVREMIKLLRTEKRCHIGAFIYSALRPTRIYHPGPGVDAVSEPPSRPRVVQPPVCVFRRDPLVAALFGEAPKC